MNGPRKLLITSGLLLAMWGMGWGLIYAVFVEHQTLDALIAWSYDRLAESERTETILAYQAVILFAAIGPVTEAALRKANVERVVLAHDTTVAAVLAALMDFFSQPGAILPAGVKPG